MAKKYINWKTKGMNRDMSVSAFNSEFAFENINMRLSTNEGNTMMSWVNERGTKELKLYINTNPGNTSGNTFTDSIEGTVIGTAVLNGNLVLFTHKDSTDCIYAFSLPTVKVDYDLYGRLLFKGDLGFDVQYPIETLVSYESENIQKVYWTDGKNQPRVINIAPFMNKKVSGYTANTFNFIQELKLEEGFAVSKSYGTGEFPAGVIQYALTYYNKYGQESNIFYTTPLCFISYKDRGGKPGEKIANTFKIKVSNVDTSFDYIRLYSILRTSKDAVPLVKRVQDIETASTVTFIDNGNSGETIDPTELLYKGGEEITVKTMEQKDGTLFLGNIKTEKMGISESLREQVKSVLSADGNIGTTLLKFTSNAGYSSNDPFYATNNSLNRSGFKSNEYYRIGIQFQYKTGKWSAPIWIKDLKIDKYPTVDVNTLSIPQIAVLLPSTYSSLWTSLIDAGYKRARLMMAQPSENDRTIICQGIANPTLTTKRDRYSIGTDGFPDTTTMGNLYAQSSWFFRPDTHSSSYGSLDLSVAPDGGGYIPSSGSLVSMDTLLVPTTSRQNAIEIGTKTDSYNCPSVDQTFITLHSPEINFDDSLYSRDFTGATLHKVGYVYFNRTFGDIDIQTSSPTIGSAPGFIHKSVVTAGNAGLVSGLFYEDFIVDDAGTDNKEYVRYDKMHVPVKWPVALWQRNGSLNNDVNRDARSSKLLKKKVSNYRVGSSANFTTVTDVTTYDIQLFSSDELSYIKVNGHPYMGNIDSMIAPLEPEYKYFAGDPTREKTATAPTFLTKCYYMLALGSPGDVSSTHGIWHFENNNWASKTDDIGNTYTDLCETSEPVRIKYKSTPHLVAHIGNTNLFDISNGCLPLVEVRKSYNADTLYGGQSDDALQANTWIPISISYHLSKTETVTLISSSGDTYYQTYECLKTYAFTFEDINQVVEIASFPCETHVSLAGRYDRNSKQESNLNMSPANFNLINPVYSQLDNFFNYKILDDSYYDNDTFANQITWTKTKQNGADVDLWTNITLANVLEMDGDKGDINKLTRLNNQLICFQDSGISQILYNENTQITSTEGVPIEIANSGKVQGKRYYSDTVGCSDKWSLVQTPSGIYFMDSNNKGIYRFNGQLENVTSALGFDAWAKQTLPSQDTEWNPVDFANFIAYYDKLNQDVMFVNADTALAYSEKFKVFTSFYDYGKTPYFCNLDDMGIWVKDGKLWRHQAGEYCNFFGKNRPYSMTLIGNAEPLIDKVFTNLEFRACVDGEGTYDTAKDKFSPLLPFDTVEIWNEYQHGTLALSEKNGHSKFLHGLDDRTASINRKFRIWRCDLPRDNAPVNDTTESLMGIKRFKARPLDRIRNPWAYIKIGKNVPGSGYLGKVEVHDIMATYFA